jgi:hypothetical protein
MFTPQHHSWPLAGVAQVWLPPPTTLAQLLTVPTWTGVVRLVVSPSPSCPEELSPQHQRVPVTRLTQVWLPPAPAVAQSVMVPTWVGLVRSMVSPRPSCPYSLSPQPKSANPVNLVAATHCAVVDVVAVKAAYELETPNNPSANAPAMAQPQARALSLTEMTQSLSTRRPGRLGRLAQTRRD